MQKALVIFTVGLRTRLEIGHRRQEGAIIVLSDSKALTSEVSINPRTEVCHFYWQRIPMGVLGNSRRGEGLVRLNMKSYGNHNSTYDSRILRIRPEYVIDNPPHGLYGEMEHQLNGYSYSGLDYLLQDVAGYQAAGIKVIGYITGGYEGGAGEDTGGDGYGSYWYSLELNKMLIRNMAEIDGVDGVFIDECSSYPNTSSKAYLRELTDLAHSYGLITWGNVGVDQFDDWFFTEGGFDLMQSSERWQGQSLSQVQQDWGYRVSVTGFNASYTAEDAFNLTIDAWEKGLAYCYINNVEYVSIAPWFEEYTALLRDYQ